MESTRNGPRFGPLAVPLAIPDSPEFNRLAAGDDRADLARIALEIARDAHPGLDPGPYLARIDALADRVRPRCPAGATTEAVLQQVNWVLYVEEGFSGNDEDYYDPSNSYLDEVIDRRTGIPISLGILYRAVAERLGLAMAGVNLPSHFVLRADRPDGSPVFVDAFQGGALLDRDGCRRLVASRTGQPVALAEEQFRAVQTAAVVARMLRNLQGIYARAGDFAAALPVVRRLAAIEPGEAVHRRAIGAICLGLERPAEAVEHLSAYLEQADQPRDQEIVRGMIQEARRRIAERE